MLSLFAIFLAFMKIGALAFGGAYAAMPLIEQQIVDRLGWMSFREFLDLTAIDELTPGPILINSATFIGMKLAGLPGAVVATLGCIVPACIVTTILTILYRRYRSLPVIAEIMNCLRCMSAALIFSTALKIFASAVFPSGLSLNDMDILALMLSVASYLVLKKSGLNPIFIILACGAVSLLASFLS